MPCRASRSRSDARFVRIALIVMAVLSLSAGGKPARAENYVWGGHPVTCDGNPRSSFGWLDDPCDNVLDTGYYWDNPNNWTPAGIPGGGDIVTVNSGVVGINLRGSVTVGRLNLGNSIGDPSHPNEIGPNSITVLDGLTWDSSGGLYSLTLNVAKGAVMDFKAFPNGLISDGVINNEGVVHFKGGGNSTALEGAAFNNRPGALFLFEDDSNLSIAHSGKAATFNNAGTVRKTGGTGTGGISGIAFNNTGVVDSQSGTIQLYTGTHSGVLHTERGAGITLYNVGSAAPFTFAPESRIAGEGVTRSFGGPTVQGTLTVGDSPDSAAVFEVNGIDTLDGSLTFVTLGDSAVRVQPGFITGTFNVAPDSRLDLLGNQSGPVALAGTLNNRGTVNESNGYIVGGNPETAAFNNLEGGTYNVLAPVSYRATFTNSGTLNLGVTAPASLDVTGDFTQTATGVLHLGLGVPPPNFPPSGRLSVLGKSALDGAVRARYLTSDPVDLTPPLLVFDAKSGRTGDFAAKTGGAYEWKTEFNGDHLSLTPDPPAPPANDNIANAQAISGAFGSADGESVAATEEYPFLKAGQAEPLYGGRHGGRSIWYRWTAPYTGDVEFDTKGSSFDTLLAAYSSGPAPAYDDFLTVAGNDDALDSNGRIHFLAKEGQLYYLAVAGYGSKGGLTRLNWRMAPAPAPADTAPQTLTGFSPIVARVGGVDAAGFLDLTLTGTGFTPDSRLFVNGRPLTGGSTNFASPTELHAFLNADYLAAETTLTLQVGTPAGPDRTFLTNRGHLHVMNYAVATAPPGGSATAETPGKKNFKLLSSVEATVTNPGPSPVTVTPAEYPLGLVSLVVELSKKLADAFTQNILSASLNPVGVTDATRIDMQLVVPATDVPGVATAQLPPGAALPPTSQVVSNDGASVISNDGASLITNDGGSLITNDGGSYVPPVGGKWNGGGPAPLQSPPTAWHVVRGSGGKPPAIANTLDTETGIPAGTVSLTFDNTSTPKVTELSGKVFAVVIPRYGDLNGDGSVDVADAIRGLQAIVGLAELDELQTLNGDLSPAPGAGPNAGAPFGDGQIDISDVIRLLRRIVGLEPDPFP